MPNSKIDHESETFIKLKDAGVPDWVLPLDAIAEEPGKVFERMRAEYRDLAPPFLALFESDPDAITAEDSDRMNYGLFLAAEFKDERFSDALLKVLRVDEDLLEFLFGDLLTTAMHECIARICWRDLEGIKALALDPKVDRFARWTALDSFERLLFHEHYSEERLKAELRDVITKLEDNELWDAIASVVTSLGWIEFEKEVIDANEAGYIEDMIFEDAEAIRSEMKKMADHQAVEEEEAFDAVIILEKFWEWSQKIGAEIDEMEEMWKIENREEGWDHESAAEKIATPAGYMLDEGGGLMRDAGKVGRNDPCPCGSGKKFKKCCG